MDGEMDQQNKASQYAVEALLRKAWPRIVTVEQTFGIMHPTHRRHFHALVRMFSDGGFAVSWSLVRLVE